ncbi:MAG: hypothetical protein U1E65_12960 [Myxococcota bacterium]
MRSGLVFLCLVVGCAVAPRKDPVSFQPRSSITADDYEDILEAWTRSDRVYKEVGSVLHVYATLRSPELDLAQAARSKRVYGAGGDRIGDRFDSLCRSSSVTAGGLQFFFAATTGVSRWNDFENRNSIWRVTVENDAGTRVAGVVHKVKVDANLRAVYPYVTDLTKAFVVEFPPADHEGKPLHAPETHQLVLRFTSGLAEIPLYWDLKR